MRANPILAYVGANGNSLAVLGASGQNWSKLNLFCLHFLVHLIPKGILQHFAFSLLIKCVVGLWGRGCSMHLMLANPAWAKLPFFATAPISHLLLFPKIASQAISEELNPGVSQSHLADGMFLWTLFPYYADTVINSMCCKLTLADVISETIFITQRQQGWVKSHRAGVIEPVVSTVFYP